MKRGEFRQEEDVMRSRRAACYLALFFAPTVLADTIWTETFDSGVGRLDQTRGQGDARFAWDAGDQAIDGTFIRYPHASPSVDQRFALLDDGPFNVDEAVLGFSAVVTPLSGDGGGSPANANIAFINSASPGWEYLSVRFRAEENRISIGIQGGGGGVGSVPFTYGTTYFVDAVLDGPNELFEVNVYQGVDATGTFLGSMTKSPINMPVIDALGFTNPMTASTEKQFHARIDEISFTVPEPATAVLASVALLALIRRRSN